MFESPDRLVLGLATGIVFGFLLQKGRVAKYQVILGQLLLKDWTVLKIMLTAIGVGAIGVYALVALEMANLHIKPMLWGGVLLGGIFFGIGIAIFGYCPGTGVAACGEGRKDAMVGVAGMLAGAGIFVWMYPMWLPIIRDYGDWGKITLSEVIGIPGWVWILLVIMIAVGINLAMPHSCPTIQDKPEKTGFP
ncbi:MAG: YeeE/YedE family protein [Nitrospira sp.]|nr:YeeE/YedE family protein [Nitrospira sp.]HBP86772.1 YeeE/YedE family protein [Nitrospiraceae bacterium]HNP27775.1 YeeE/YedE thiosulfate transporter family protein [Nitrospirales bacterium]